MTVGGRSNQSICDGSMSWTEYYVIIKTVYTVFTKETKSGMASCSVLGNAVERQDSVYVLAGPGSRETIKVR